MQHEAQLFLDMHLPIQTKEGTPWDSHLKRAEKRGLTRWLGTKPLGTVGYYILGIDCTGTLCIMEVYDDGTTAKYVDDRPSIWRVWHSYKPL